MNFLYFFLMVMMLLDCLILVLLVLLQLPKKDAGAGLAFGGGTTDALFGAGSGNVLTRITKWAGGLFFGLAILMAIVAARQNKNTGAGALQQSLMESTPAAATSPSGMAPMSSNKAPVQMPLLTNVPKAMMAPATKAATNVTSTNK